MGNYKPSDISPEQNLCPSPEAAIEQYLKLTKRKIPKIFPEDGYQAARYWMAHQAPGDDFTEASLPPTSKKGSWTTPYHDRLIYTLRKFLKLKHPQQLYVIEHIEKGVAWKGDDISFYTSVVEETFKMQKNRKQYVDDGFKKMKKALRGMVA